MTHKTISDNNYLLHIITCAGTVLSGVLPGVLQGVLSIVLPGVLSVVLPGVLPAVLPGVLPGVMPVVLPGVLPVVLASRSDSCYARCPVFRSATCSTR